MSRRSTCFRSLVALVMMGCASVGEPYGSDGSVAVVDAPPAMPIDASGDGAVTCDDGSPEGTCAPMACRSVLCTAGTCTYTVLGDGASCGAAASSRCCAGACVDVSSDVANCGGCGLACSGGQTCESVAATDDCDPHPAATSGRCTPCTANAQCPRSPSGGRQICPVASANHGDHCAPDAVNDCAAGQTMESVPFCPDYCAYPPP